MFVIALKRFVQALVEPWATLLLSAALLPYTTIRLIVLGEFRTMLSPSKLSDELFANVWAVIGPEAKSRAQGLVIPLLEGKVSGGKVHEEIVSIPLHGTVLEVGAGAGAWLDIFSRIHAHGNGVITKIYGVEPNAHSAAALYNSVEKTGLNGLYEVVPVGIESVTDPKAWGRIIEPESIDCIVSIRCLCSIPEPEKNIALLYKLLKPGGSWYVFEHVKTTRGAPFMPLYQRFVNSIWMYFMGSCRICRSTDQTLHQVGTWKAFDLTVLPDEPICTILPHIMGVLTK